MRANGEHKQPVETKEVSNILVISYIYNTYKNILLVTKCNLHINTYKISLYLCIRKGVMQLISVYVIKVLHTHINVRLYF